jgi:hypothetical protein
MVKKLIQIKAILIGMNWVRNWVKGCEFGQENVWVRSAAQKLDEELWNWKWKYASSKVEVFKYDPVVRGSLTNWSMCSIEVKWVAAQSKGLKESCYGSPATNTTPSQLLIEVRWRVEMHPSWQSDSKAANQSNQLKQQILDYISWSSVPE